MSLVFRVEMEFSRLSVFNQKYSWETDVIDVQKYFDEYKKVIYTPSTVIKSPEDEHEACKAALDLTDSTKLYELESTTSEHNLTCEGEVTPFEFDLHEKISEFNLNYNLNCPENDSSATLISLQKRMNAEKTRKRSVYTKNFLKYETYQFQNYESKNYLKKDIDHCRNKTIVICVKVYHSFLSCKRVTRAFKLLQEIHILGDQLLSQLKDSISCPMDYVGISDGSNDCFLEDEGLKMTAKEKYPSSFIFIENTFYNDTRTDKMKDLSKTIRDWGRERGLGPFYTANMQDVKMTDIKVRIGRPYVYQHQGNCEHLLVFSDIRLSTKADPQKRRLYPKFHATSRSRAKYCMMCGTAYARWLVLGNKRLTHDKSYLCRKCFLSYNYINGVKVGEFEAYEYVDPVAVL